MSIGDNSTTCIPLFLFQEREQPWIMAALEDFAIRELRTDSANY